MKESPEPRNTPIKDNSHFLGTIVYLTFCKQICEAVLKLKKIFFCEIADMKTRPPGILKLLSNVCTYVCFKFVCACM